MSNKKEVGTYLLHNKETGEAYVGSGILNQRRNNHFNKLEKNVHDNKKLQDAYNKNPNFDFVPVVTPNREVAFDFEQSIIDEFISSELLLNIVPNARYGPAPGFKPSLEQCEKQRQMMLGTVQSEETKEKRRQSMLKRYTEGFVAPAKGLSKSLETIEKHRKASTGRVVSDETREKLRVAHIGKIMPPEAVERIRQLNTGKKHTEETKEKMSLAHKGIPKSQEHKDKIGASNKGKIISEEQKQMVSLVHKGKKLSDEHIASISNKVIINGVTYKSVADASRQLNINKSTLHWQIKHNKIENCELE